MKRIIKKLFWDVFLGFMCFVFMKNFRFTIPAHHVFFKRPIYIQKKYFSSKIFTLSHQHKTLPETQWTQSIDSISSVNLSSWIVHEWFQWHYLNWIGCKFGHQMAPLALIFGLSVVVGWVSSIVTLPWNALLALSVSIEFVSSSARISKQRLSQIQVSTCK